MGIRWILRTQPSLEAAADQFTNSISASLWAPKTPALHTELCATPWLHSVVCCSEKNQKTKLAWQVRCGGNRNNKGLLQIYKFACPCKHLRQFISCDWEGWITQGHRGALASRCCTGSTTQTKTFAQICKFAHVDGFVQVVFVPLHLGPPGPFSFKILWYIE